MSRYKHNLVDLDVKKLFVEHKIDEIVEIDKLLDAEIEHKRNELRSMVGDRYKDILIASDSIKTMKNVLNNIVDGVQNMNESCQFLLENSGELTSKSRISQPNEGKIAERNFVVQVRLSIHLNSEIWSCIHDEDYLKAVRLYLLARSIHTGLSCSKFEHIERVPLLNQIKLDLDTLRGLIHVKIVHKLESIDLSSETASGNLSAILLLARKTYVELAQILISHRESALKTVQNSHFSSVRMQIGAMIKWFVTTLELLYDCFMDNGRQTDGGLILLKLDEIPDTILSNSDLWCVSSLNDYIPKIVRNFKYDVVAINIIRNETGIIRLVLNWVAETKNSLVLDEALKNVTNFKGLYAIREEAAKIEVVPENVCRRLLLRQNFNVWQYFFQSFLTQRALELIRIKVENNFTNFKVEIDQVLNEFSKFETRLDLFETEKKSLGFPLCVVQLCKDFDQSFLELLKDFSWYIHSAKLDEIPIKKCVDFEILQNALMEQCQDFCDEVITFFKEKNAGNDVEITIFLTRLIQGVLQLCEHLKKCLSIENYAKFSNKFNDVSTSFWNAWIEFTCNETQKKCVEIYEKLDVKSTLNMFHKWECIEIQEQTDENVFKSQIKVPSKPSCKLIKIMENLNEEICKVQPHTIPKKIHVGFIEKNVEIVFKHFESLIKNFEINQNQALQLLFDVKFITIFCITRENGSVHSKSQSLCDTLRSKIDPFDLDVFYGYLQANVQRSAVQNQLIFGCLLPASTQLASFDSSDRKQEVEPSILYVNSVNEWFPLLPITAPSSSASSKTTGNYKFPKQVETSDDSSSSKKQKGSSNNSSAPSSLFSNLTSDWF